MKAIAALAALALSAGSLTAQTKDCEPVADRAGRTLGCFISHRLPLGPLPRDTALYWYVDSLPDSSTYVPTAARTVVVHSLDATWLFTIAAKGAPSVAGRRVAVIGPMPLVQADSFTATYMEGVFQPGMESPVHRHPGAEAWYTLNGAQCLETPTGRMIQRAGEGGAIVTGGQPMRLRGIGTGVRRSLVLILQDASKPRQTHADDWTPKDLCRNL